MYAFGVVCGFLEDGLVYLVDIFTFGADLVLIHELEHMLPLAARGRRIQPSFEFHDAIRPSLTPAEGTDEFDQLSVNSMAVLHFPS